MNTPKLKKQVLQSASGWRRAIDIAAVVLTAIIAVTGFVVGTLVLIVCSAAWHKK